MEQFNDYEEKPIHMETGVRPDDYKTLSILMICFGVVACCCCAMNPMFLIFGILAIVSGNKVAPYFSAGAYAEAQQASDKAKKWLIRGLIAGIGWIIFYYAIYFVVLYTHPELIEQFMEQYKDVLGELGKNA